MIDLGRQFAQRIQAWQEELGRQVSEPVGEAVFEGFASRDILTPAQAEERPFRLFPCPRHICPQALQPAFSRLRYASGGFP